MSMKPRLLLTTCIVLLLICLTVFSISAVFAAQVQNVSGFHASVISHYLLAGNGTVGGQAHNSIAGDGTVAGQPRASNGSAGGHNFIAGDGTAGGQAHNFIAGDGTAGGQAHNFIAGNGTVGGQARG